MASNMILEGDYKGKLIVIAKNKLVIFSGMFKEKIDLDRNTIESYEVITEEHRKSAASGISRGLVGGALLGPVGMLAGLSAKNKGDYNIIIELKDGKRFMAEVDDKVYKLLTRIMF